MTERRLYNIREFRKPGTTYAAYAIPDGVMRIDRASRWGNPYTHLTHRTAAQEHVATREETIRRYQGWLHERIQEDPAFIEPLRGKPLACWCRPPEGFNGRLLCHGQVLVGLMDSVEPQAVE